MPIYVRFTVKSKRVDLATGLFIHPKQWSESRQRVKEKVPNAPIINERLDRLKTEIQDLYNQFRSGKDNFTVSELKDSLLDVEKSKGVMEIFDYYLESTLAKLNKGYAMETYKHLRRVLNLVVSMDHIQKNPYKKFKVGLKEIHREFLIADELSRIEAKEIQIE